MAEVPQRVEAQNPAEPPSSAQVPPRPSAAVPVRFTVEPFDASIAGLSLTLPGDPSFTKMAQQLVSADKLERYGSQAVILTNNSGQALRALGFYFTIDRVINGKHPVESYLIAKDDLSPTVVAAGARIFLPYRSMFKLTSRTQPEATRNVSFSLDLVVYSDWRVAGPDVRQHLMARVANMRAKSDVCEHIDSFTAPSVATLDWLKNASATQIDVKSPTTDESEYKLGTQREAERLWHMLQPSDAATSVAINYCAPAKSALEAAASLHR